MKMIRTGITGGIGCGKSFVCRMIEQQTGQPVYDCDAAAKRLMVESPIIRRRLKQLIGLEAYTCSTEAGTRKRVYQLNKPVIARFLMSSPENAEALEGIVHPQVFADFVNSGMEWVESAILYESGLNCFVDRVVVVTAPLEVRIARIMQRDGITREKALEWIARQLPQEQVVGMAGYVIVNDGQEPLMPQIKKLLSENRPCQIPL